MAARDDGVVDVEGAGIGLATAAGAMARYAVCRAVKLRARRYALRPAMLETLHPGLSAAPAPALVALSEHLIERESRRSRRLIGFGGEIGLLNARAALLLGRTLRRSLAKRTPGRHPEPHRPGHGGAAGSCSEPGSPGWV